MVVGIIGGLGLITAFLAWRLWEAERYIDEIEDELAHTARELKHAKWEFADRCVFKEGMW